jgi:hypothetical protein
MLPSKISELRPDERFCRHCERPLKRSFVWLELNCMTGEYSDANDIPEAESQGWFPIGTTCAKKLLKRR